MLPNPVYTLIIDGQRWDIWKEMSLSRSIERMGGSFAARLAKKPDDGFLVDVVRPGLPIQIEIDGNTVLDGYIDEVAHSYNADDAEIAIGGRDKTGDLVDCAATVDGPFEFNNIKLESMIEKVLKPFGIPLIVDVDTGAPFRRLAIQPGETAFSFIDRICRYRAVLPVSNGIGGLVLVKPSNEKSPGRLVYGQNILKGDVRLNCTERFNLYVLKGQAEGFDESTGEEVAANEGRATDDLVRRYRPTVITAESQGYNQTLQERAEWQRNTNHARGNTASYDVQGWYASPESKALWKPNTLVMVSDAPRSINREMLIVSMTMMRGSGGTITTLELAVPEAYELVAEVEPESSGSGASSNGASGAMDEDYDLMGLV